ncbi:MAG: coniferyl aldehyde dehydrogenase [Planctomycetota bacterium]|nr:coniferyl aldehyde dehydrogenase [Planctomycetota bacterium]
MAVMEKSSSSPPLDLESTLRDRLEEQRRAFLRDGPPTARQRRELLDRLRGAIISRQDGFIEAISTDFGHRSSHETRLGEFFTTLKSLQHARKNLGRWMKPRRRPVALEFQPGRAKVHVQPLGVVGIIGPWNYPLSLAGGPLAAAIAAGNRVMVKPSELTPRTSELFAQMIEEIYAPEEVSVFLGGPEVGMAFSRLPFDHLFFTGSTAVGRSVMKAAAENMVPVTLELGGKSPAIVSNDFPIEVAATSIMSGKLFNAGQTCIAPDHVFVPADSLDRFVESATQAVRKMYPTLAENPDFTSIVADRHYERVQSLLADARESGARVIEINPAGEELPAQGRKIAPTLIVEATDSMGVLEKEIFGPVLPILPYDSIDEVIERVNRGPRALALYYFSRKSSAVARMLERTTTGGATINDTLLHVAQEELPFGGIGASGIGAYHGSYGFETFSHRKGVFYQSRFNAAGLLRPPYGGMIDRILSFLIPR